MVKGTYVIYNPIAGAGKAKAAWNLLQPELEKWCAGVYTLLQTTRKGDATGFAHRIAQEGGGLIMVVCGDGTINEVANGLLSAGESAAAHCEIGIINGGSGAGLAQSLGLPADVRDQIALIFQKQSKPLDAGITTCQDERGNVVERYFVSECQAGIGGAVVAEVGLGRKRLGGSIGFGLGAVSQLIRYRAQETHVRLDDTTAVSRRMLGIVVGNGNYCAGGMQLTPGARTDDGLFTVLLIGQMNLLTRLYTFSKVYEGAHIRSPHYALKQARQIEMVSELPVWVETDGELIGKTPCTIRMLPAALRVRYS